MRKALLLAATLPLLAGAAPAEAATTRTCVTTGGVTFSPPVTLDPHSGTGSVSYTARCVVVYSSGASGVDTYTSSTSFGYSGSCITATLTGPVTSTGVMVGGTTITNWELSTAVVRAREWVLTSTNPCAMSSAGLVQVGQDVFVS